MKFVSLSGPIVSVRNPHQYRIKWSEKSLSDFQFRVKRLLKPIWFAHIVFEEFPIAGTKMSLDFYNDTKKIAIEVQGAQHLGYNKFFHGPTKVPYIKQLQRDGAKDLFCEKNGIRLIEVYPTDILDATLIEKFNL